MLHRRGMVSAMLFEGWAKDEKEAMELLHSGEIKIDSALNHNTVGAGTGIITKSLAMIVVEDRRNHTRAATFPAEGPFEGGFCGWGLYSKDIAENLRHMREELFPPMREMLAKNGGIALKPILAESMQMGDENHTRQTAADLLFDKIVLPQLFALDLPKEVIMQTIKYIVDTPRFFHCYGQGASRSAAIAADGIPYSTMVTAFGGNGREFGIKVAGLPGRWFTAPAPYMTGKYTSTKFTQADQLPWIGDSCVVEAAGMGGVAAAASRSFSTSGACPLPRRSRRPARWSRSPSPITPISPYPIWTLTRCPSASIYALCSRPVSARPSTAVCSIRKAA